MQSASETDLRGGKALAVGMLKAARERDTFLPARLSIDDDAHLTATPVKWVGSSDFIGFAKADVLAFVPGGKTINTGEIVEILFI